MKLSVIWRKASAIFVNSLSFDSTLFLCLSGDGVGTTRGKTICLRVSSFGSKKKRCSFVVRWYNSAGRQGGALACQHNNAPSIRHRKKRWQ